MLQVRNTKAGRTCRGQKGACKNTMGKGESELPGHGRKGKCGGCCLCKDAERISVVQGREERRTILKCT